MKEHWTDYYLNYPLSWDNLYKGTQTKEAIKLKVNNYKRFLFGPTCMKLGPLSFIFKSSSKYNINLSDCLKIEGSNIICNTHDLPLQNNSIDVSYIIYQLDYSFYPQKLLKEIDRVMSTDGTLMIVGFNPFSVNYLLNFSKAINKKIRLGFYTPYTLKDWLFFLNYEVIVFENFFVLNQYSNKLKWITDKLECHCQLFGNSYFLIAKKRTYPLTPLKVGKKNISYRPIVVS